MRIVFLGPPGAGKGTQSKQVAEELGIAHLSTGELLRDACTYRTDLGLLVADYLDAGELVPDDVVMDIVADRTAQPYCAKGCVFDGFPRTLAQAVALDKLLAERGTPIDLVIEFVIDQEILLERLMARGRRDDNMVTIRQRLKSYQEDTKPLVTYYSDRGVLRSINAAGSPSQVHAELQAAIKSAGVKSE
jgi:adenylate kinase